MNKLQKIIVKLFKIPIFPNTPPVTVVYNFKPITLKSSIILDTFEQSLIDDGTIGEGAIKERLLRSMEEELIHYLELQCEKDYPLFGGVMYRGKLCVLIPESQSYENKERRE